MKARLSDGEYLRLLLEAVPAKIIGDKKGLLAEIAASVPSDARIGYEGFAGAALLSAYMKHRGYRIVSNEIRLAPFEWIKAHIENNTTTISAMEVDALLSKPRTARKGFRNHFSQILGKDNAVFFDRVSSNLDRLDSDLKRSIAISALNITVESHLTHWNCHPTVDRSGLCGTGNFSKHDLERDWREYIIQKFPLLLCDNGQRNLAYNEDAASLAGRVQADFAYFDPPYPSTCNNYEWSYRLYDLFTVLCRGGRLGPDPWTEDHLKPHRHFGGRREGLGNLWELMMRSDHIPHWIISINENSSVRTDHLAALIEPTGRSVEIQKFDTRHPATAASPAGWTREYLLVCRPNTVVRSSTRGLPKQGETAP